MSSFEDQEQSVLDDLADRFMAALTAKDRGNVDKAEEILLDILKIEPRLPEPHLELARVLLDTERARDAEPHAREAIAHLRAGGQWIDEVPENVLQALAHATLAEILRRQADEDDVIFGDPAAFKALVDEAKLHFARAAELDPSDAYSSYHAYFLGPAPGQKPIVPAIDADDA